eukprot:6649339-Prymnesium_polylepis.2
MESTVEAITASANNVVSHTSLVSCSTHSGANQKSPFFSASFACLTFFVRATTLRCLEPSWSAFRPPCALFRTVTEVVWICNA